MSEALSGSPENSASENTPQQIAKDIKALASPGNIRRRDAEQIADNDEPRTLEIDRIADKVISNLNQAPDHLAGVKFTDELTTAFFGTIGPAPGMHKNVFESYTDVMLRTAAKLGEASTSR